MADVNEYKCPSCGAPMDFDITHQKMICHYCSSEFGLDYIRSNFNEVTDEKLKDFDWVERTNYVWEPDVEERLKEYTCSSCGGTIITSSSFSAVKCPFCSHNVIISSNFKGDVRPDKVIPFKVQADEFEKKYREYISGIKYIPKEFKDVNVTDNIFGCYIPIWLYSCKCETFLDDCTTASIRIKDYPIIATDVDKKLFYTIEPFIYDEAEDFTESCLTGFSAKRYSVGAENAMESIAQKIKTTCFVKGAAPLIESYYDPTQPNNSVISDKKLKYYLVPVWFMNITYNGEQYKFGMNGQTGEFVNPDGLYKFKASFKNFIKRYAIINLLVSIIMFSDIYDSPDPLIVKMFIAVFMTFFILLPYTFIKFIYFDYINHISNKNGSYSIEPIENRPVKIEDFIDGDVVINTVK
ncbi:MAG: hypothetical protein K6G20_12825 [Ruminococcus sp.]|nr:hypothetical protein [Ruminococcus sp.]